MESDKGFPLFLARVVTGVWVLSMMGDAAVQSYDPPATVHGLMMAVAGWAFGSHLFTKGE